MSVRSWSFVNGVSDELVRALAVTTARAGDEPDQEIRGLYEKAEQRIAALSNEEMLSHDAE